MKEKKNITRKSKVWRQTLTKRKKKHFYVSLLKVFDSALKKK